MRALIITADDYGYRSAYSDGILEAATAGAIDAVAVMVRRGPLDAAAVRETGVELGLHLELAPSRGARAGPEERGAAVTSVREQIARFEDGTGVPPAFLNGHGHCHAAPGLAHVVAREASARDLPVRSVNPRHRRLLRCLGVRTADRLVGRMGESEPSLPPEVRGLMAGEDAGPDVVEWMVHPGHADPAGGSRYDAGRREDLELLLRLVDRSPLRRLRATHAEALAA